MSLSTSPMDMNEYCRSIYILSANVVDVALIVYIFTQLYYILFTLCKFYKCNSHKLAIASSWFFNGNVTLSYTRNAHFTFVTTF